MKIAFFLQNGNFKDVDCCDIEHGNPGIGGTEYIIQATAHYIKKAHPQDIEIVFGAESIENVPLTLQPALKVNSIEDLINLCNPDYVLFKYTYDVYKQATACVCDKKNRLLVWAHNFIKRTDLTVLSNDKNVARIVCVSREQLDMYRDHKAFKKSIYVYNGMPAANMEKEKGNILSLENRPKEVTYIGSIVDYKGFHLLAKAWKQVLAKVPDARLNVIGSGKLYDRTAKLGKYGIADEGYENVFMPYLTDEYGKILPSVKFWGVLGKEKNDILDRTRVGVPNPSGVSETFCITALEMQAMGALVTTIAYGGFMNTVYKTGKLYNDTNDLAECIVELLECKENDLNGFYDFMCENFAFEKIAKDWLDVFDDLKHGRMPEYIYCKHDNAWLNRKEANRRLKSALPLGYILPTIDFYRSILRRLKLVK